MADDQNRAPVRLTRWLCSLIEPLPVDTVERIRLHQFSVFLLTGIPTLVVFGIYHLTKGDRTLGLISFVLTVSLGASRSLLKSLRSGLLLYRLNAFLFAGLLLYMVVIGGSGGSKALWMFVFPLIVFFLLGEREGLAWVSGLFAVAAGFYSGLVPGLRIFPYQGEFAMRFSMTFWIITAIGYWFEFLRQHYRRGMEAEQARLLAEQALLREEIAGRRAAEQAREDLIQELQAAMAKVKQLSGLLPICSACKKIRDDGGAWVPIESYFRERSEAKFSHSLCPDCGEQLYPGLRHRS